MKIVGSSRKAHEVFIQRNLEEFKRGYPNDHNFVKNFNIWCKENGFAAHNASNVNGLFDQLCENKRLKVPSGQRRYHWILFERCYSQFEGIKDEVNDEVDDEAA